MLKHKVLYELLIFRDAFNGTENEVDQNIDPSHPNDLDQQKVEFVPKKKESQKKVKRPSLAKILFFQFWKRFFAVALLKLVHDICLFIQPQMLE